MSLFIQAFWLFNFLCDHHIINMFANAFMWAAHCHIYMHWLKCHLSGSKSKYFTNVDDGTEGKVKDSPKLLQFILRGASMSMNINDSELNLQLTFWNCSALTQQCNLEKCSMQTETTDHACFTQSCFLGLKWNRKCVETHFSAYKSFCCSPVEWQW